MCAYVPMFYFYFVFVLFSRTDTTVSQKHLAPQCCLNSQNSMAERKYILDGQAEHQQQ
uniref:Uncharacterized protein n=1 Tax=Setaria viridis TaxID=4556 RepID=A0A4U6V4Y9_SETVI|nr:hypothetical protein SEVIR_3G032650v2 [Setaria viridis]